MSYELNKQYGSPGCCAGHIPGICAIAVCLFLSVLALQTPHAFANEESVIQVLDNELKHFPAAYGGRRNIEWTITLKNSSPSYQRINPKVALFDSRDTKIGETSLQPRQMVLVPFQSKEVTFTAVVSKKDWKAMEYLSPVFKARVTGIEVHDSRIAESAAAEAGDVHHISVEWNIQTAANKKRNAEYAVNALFFDADYNLLSTHELATVKGEDVNGNPVIGAGKIDKAKWESAHVVAVGVSSATRLARHSGPKTKKPIMSYANSNATRSINTRAAGQSETARPSRTKSEKQNYANDFDFTEKDTCKEEVKQDKTLFRSARRKIEEIEKDIAELEQATSISRQDFQYQEQHHKMAEGGYYTVDRTSTTYYQDGKRVKSKAKIRKREKTLKRYRNTSLGELKQQLAQANRELDSEIYQYCKRKSQ